MSPASDLYSGQQPEIVTIVLNTNRKDDTLECLASLRNQTIAARNHVIVLDNHSRDGSLQAIQSAFPSVEVLSIETDRGYAGNNNVGLRSGLAYSPEWFLVLNEDTILARECLEQMLLAASGDPRIGIVGPLVLHHDEPTVIQSAGGQLGPFWESIHVGANQPDAGGFDGSQDLDWVSGCALLVRRSVVEQQGMLDERFYYYWEETEWCLRARKAGWRIVLAPGARLWHKGVRRDYKPSANVTYYNTRNRFLMMATHRPPLRVWSMAWYQTIRTLVSWSVQPKWWSEREHRNAMLEGVKDFLLGHWGSRPA
jgi:GT2 family glycosyltransferase